MSGPASGAGAGSEKESCQLSSSVGLSWGTSLVAQLPVEQQQPDGPGAFSSDRPLQNAQLRDTAPTRSLSNRGQGVCPRIHLRGRPPPRASQPPRALVHSEPGLTVIDDDLVPGEDRAAFAGQHRASDAGGGGTVPRATVGGVDTPLQQQRVALACSEVRAWVESSDAALQLSIASQAEVDAVAESADVALQQSTIEQAEAAALAESAARADSVR